MLKVKYVDIPRGWGITMRGDIEIPRESAKPMKSDRQHRLGREKETIGRV